MNSKLYVGNISFQTKDEDLQKLFEPFGTVVSVKVITDRDTGRSRGFAFVEMETEEQAEEAIAGLNGKEAQGRTLRINIAKEKTERPPRR